MLLVTLGNSDSNKPRLHSLRSIPAETFNLVSPLCGPIVPREPARTTLRKASECSTPFRPFGCAFGHPLVSQTSLRGETLFSILKTKNSNKGVLTMQSHTFTPKGHSRTSESSTRTQIDTPKWSALLVEAVNKPGLIMDAYSAFHNYSIGNQLLAIVQCQLRGLEAGPINTFPGWQALGRNVKRGERALILCMPITRKVRNEETRETEDKDKHTFASFVYKPRWFVISQTIGDEFTPTRVPEWDAQRTLEELSIEQIPFTETNGNVQGYARKRQVAINPVAQLPMKTLFHETAHVMLGHTSEADFTDTERTPKNLREVEAEAVALLCCEALNLEGADYCRGYIQNWLCPSIGYRGDAIHERSAQKIFHAADQILKAGRLQHQTEAGQESADTLA
jgi:hypothetical protein